MNPRQPESQSGTLPAELQPPSEKLKIIQALKPEINCFRNSLACPTGIEPVTPSLEGWCSIRLSYGHNSFRTDNTWSGWRDSNSRHPAPKAGTLPGCVTPRRRETIRVKRANGQYWGGRAGFTGRTNIQLDCAAGRFLILKRLF